MTVECQCRYVNDGALLRDFYGPVASRLSGSGRSAQGCMPDPQISADLLAMHMPIWHTPPSVPPLKLCASLEAVCPPWSCVLPLKLCAPLKAVCHPLKLCGPPWSCVPPLKLCSPLEAVSPHIHSVYIFRFSLHMETWFLDNVVSRNHSKLFGVFHRAMCFWHTSAPIRFPFSESIILWQPVGTDWCDNLSQPALMQLEIVVTLAVRWKLKDLLCYRWQLNDAVFSGGKARR